MAEFKKIVMSLDFWGHKRLIMKLSLVRVTEISQACLISEFFTGFVQCNYTRALVSFQVVWGAFEKIRP